jgi:hypothetical protein
MFTNCLHTLFNKPAQCLLLKAQQDSLQINVMKQPKKPCTPCTRPLNYMIIKEINFKNSF